MAGKISEYIEVVVALKGDELLDISEVNGAAPTGFDTRSTTLNNIKAFMAPSFYEIDDILLANRTVDQDGKFLIFDNGTFFQIDDLNDGFLYDFVTKRVGIGEDVPLAKLHVRGNSSEDIVSFKGALGTDHFIMDQDGTITTKPAAGQDSLILQTIGGNDCLVKNNSNVFNLRSVGAMVMNGNSTSGAAVIANGFLSGSQAFSPQTREVQIVPNINDETEIIYADFNSLSGVQTAKFGSSTASGQEFDTWDVFSAISTYHGNLHVSTTVGTFRPPEMTGPEASLLTGVNSDMIYVNSTDGVFVTTGFWAYENGAWAKFI